MGNVIQMSEVCDILRPWVGSRLLDYRPDFPEYIAGRLTLYFSSRQTAEDLCKAVESDLLGGLSAFSGGSMRFDLDNGSIKRIYVRDLSIIADELLDPVFSRYPIRKESYEALTAYAMGHTSLPALKQLLIKFGNFLDPYEKKMLVRLVKENFLPCKYTDWLFE